MSIQNEETKGRVIARPLLMLVGGAFALTLAALVYLLWPMLSGQPPDRFGKGDYHLTSTDGAPFTEDTLAGQPSAVFFGFSHCPEVCPTTLGDISVWQEELGPDAAKLRIFFVTVDPERDTLPMLKDYVGWLPHAQGVTGPRAEIDKAIKAFRVIAMKVPLSDGSYTMDHSAYVLLFDDKGKFVEPIGYQEETARAVAKIRRLLGLPET